MMKKTLLTAMACVLALGLSASTASALAIGDTRYVGLVDPGSPANAADEVVYINFLLDMAAPSVVLDHDFPGPPGTLYDFTRSGNSCASLGGCVDATATGASNGNAPSGSVVVTGWTYLLAKYGNESHVWYVGGLVGAQVVPLNAPGGGQSHYSLYNPGTTQVPDGGVTAGLLGLAMLGVGYLRRRIG